MKYATKRKKRKSTQHPHPLTAGVSIRTPAQRKHYNEGYDTAAKEFHSRHQQLAEREKALTFDQNTKVRSANISLMSSMGQFAQAAAQVLEAMSRSIGEGRRI